MARPNNPHAKQAIAEAAMAEFADKGLQGSRVEDITRRCGFSKGSFYLHFESKEALFREQVKLLMHDVATLSKRRRTPYRKLFRRFDEGGTAPALQVEALLAHDKQYDLETLEMLWQRRSIVDVLFHGSRGTPFEHLLWQFVDAENKRVVTEVKQMRKAGLCREEIRPEVIAATVLGAWTLLARQMSQMTQKPDLAMWVESLSLMLYQGIANTPRIAARESNRLSV